MPSRREFLMTGMGAVAAGLSAGPLAKRAGAMVMPPCDPGSLSLAGTRPLVSAPLTPNPRVIDGFRFAPWFTGDDFPDQHIPFHSDETPRLPRVRSAAVDRARVAVIGGGLSGLSTAFMLRRFEPVVFELRDRFGGAAQGGVWQDSPYSLGSAYVITPDAGGFLDTFYRDLRLHEHVREDKASLTVELNGQVLDGFIDGQGFAPDELPALAAYNTLVDRMANQTYPDVPFTAPWMLALDQLTLKEHIEQETGMTMPP
ncbi:MAG: NAD(P)-binding protein, partial [Phycisphaerales bacterium JB059]